MTTATRYNYGTAILSAFEYLLENYPEVFVLGQGLECRGSCRQRDDGADRGAGTTFHFQSIRGPCREPGLQRVSVCHSQSIQ